MYETSPLMFPIQIHMTPYWSPWSTPWVSIEMSTCWPLPGPPVPIIMPPMLMLRTVPIMNPDSSESISLDAYVLLHLNTFQANYSTKETTCKIMKNMILERRVLLRRSVTKLPTVCHGALFLFFSSFPLDYITNPWMAQPPTHPHFVSFLSFYSFYYGLFVIAQQSSHI